jgi:integrase
MLRKQMDAVEGERYFGVVNKAWIAKHWRSFRPDKTYTRQKLRVTFSTLMQKISSIETAQKLLQHSDKKVTQGYYTDEEAVVRWKVNRLPISRWLGTLAGRQ